MSQVKDRFVQGMPRAESNVDSSDVLAEVGARLGLVLDRIGLSRAAALADKSEKQLRRYAAGAEAPFLVLDALVRAGGVTFDWLASGHARSAADHELSIKIAQRNLDTIARDLKTDLSDCDRRDLLELAEINRQLIAASRALLERSLGKVNHPKTRDLGGSNFVLVPSYSGVLASAGPGAVAATEQADGVISFDPRFLRDQGGNPEKCVVIWAHGDSMMPTIPDGSALIVDHSQKEIKNGSIMVIGVDDDLLVKRIRRRSDGLIELISDNRTYETETLGPAALQQLRVIGRVVYFCRTP